MRVTTDAGKLRARDKRSRTPAHGKGKGGSTRLPDILAALVDEHKYQARLLKVLETQVGQLNQRKTPDYEVMWGVMHYMTHFPDRYHHPKEDLIFEKVVQRDPASRATVRRLTQSHQSLGKHGAEVYALIEASRHGDGETEALRQATRAYITSMRKHMDIEALHLFPHATKVLRAEDWRDVDARMKPILDPIFGGQVAGEYQGLHKHYTEEVKPVGMGRLGVSLVEVVAMIEALTALIGGLRRMRNAIVLHNRDAIRRNRDFALKLGARAAPESRFKLLAQANRTNLALNKAVVAEVKSIWAATRKAAAKPYDQDAGPYAPKLFRRRKASPEAKGDTA